MKNKGHALAILFSFLAFFIYQQDLQGQVGPTVTNTVTANGFSIKKQVSNSSVPSGVVFTYTIFYTIPAGASNVVITDQIPASLVIDNVVPGSGCGTPTVTPSGNTITYAFSSVSMGCSGTFQINVHFPAGTTCPGTVARNQVCLEATGQPKICTDFISTTATAANPFAVSKGVMGLSWNPQNNGCQYITTVGDTVMYNLIVYKTSPYQGNDDGQINLNNAVVTDVLPAGAVLVSSTCGATQLGNTVTWNVGNLNAATPWVYQTCQIKVYYPAGSFPVGTQIQNMATLSGVNVCNQQFSTVSNTTCIQVAAPNPVGTLGKSVYLPNKMPGCQGVYYVTICNTGNVPLTYNVQDAVPAGLTVNSISFFSTAPVTATATYTSSATFVFASSATGSVNWTVPGGNTLASVSISQTGLPQGSCLTIQLNFTINSSVAGNTTITNCANLTSTQIPSQQACVSFVTATPAPDLCLYKEVCNPQTGYLPGSTVRYRLRIQNIGSLNASGFSITDALNANLIYAGNQIAYSSASYNPPCGGSGTTPWAISTPTVASGNVVTWNGLSIAPECQDFYYANCGVYGTQGVTFYFIEFDVTVAPDAASGIVPNTFTAQGGNLPASETSNTVNIVINVTHGTELTKELSLDNTTWMPSATVAAGGLLYYRLNMKNTGTGPIYDVRKVDLLAMNDNTNDWRVMNRSAARGSQFGVSNPMGYTYAFVSTPVGTGTAGTMPGNNLSLLNALGVNIGTTADAWPYASSGNNVGIGFGAPYALISSGIIRSAFKVTVSSGAQANSKVCNDFASGGSGKYIINGNVTFTPLTPAASNVVCATVTQPMNCCETTTIQVHQQKCCFRLITECPVKLIQVFTIGGTISSASWSCPASLGSYVGLSNATFAPASCNPTMDLCFNALPTNTTGSISVNLVITFDNGQVCEKQIKLENCKPLVPSDCCGDWKLTFKNSHFKKTGIFEYTNPSTQSICSVTIQAAPGLIAGSYTYDGSPLQTMTSTSVINFVPPAVNYIKFWVSAGFLYSSNIVLTVNYCDGTFCSDTLKWKGIIHDVSLDALSPNIPAKLWAVQLNADMNSKQSSNIAAIAVSIADYNPDAEKGPFVFAASAGRVEGEALRPEQSGLKNSWMGPYFVYATTLDETDYPDRFVPEKRIAVVIGDNSGLKTPPPLLITYFNREGEVLVTNKISDYVAGEVITSIDEAAAKASEFLQVTLYPNPANDYSTLTYALSQSRNLRIDLLDVQGRWIETIDQGTVPSGYHQLRIDTHALFSGIYFVRLQSEAGVQTVRLSVVK